MATEYLEAKDHDKVIELCNQMRERNVEDAGSYATEASVYRLQKQYDKALSTAEKGIALDDTSSEPYRQKAIVYLLQGDKKGAVENARSAFDLSLNYATSYTLAVCYLANGDQDGYNEVMSTLESYGVEMGQKVLDYKAGKLTIEDIFLNGEGMWHENPLCHREGSNISGNASACTVGALPVPQVQMPGGRCPLLSGKRAVRAWSMSLCRPGVSGF